MDSVVGIGIGWIFIGICFFFLFYFFRFIYVFSFGKSALTVAVIFGIVVVFFYSGTVKVRGDPVAPSYEVLPQQTSTSSAPSVMHAC